MIFQFRNHILKKIFNRYIKYNIFVSSHFIKFIWILLWNHLDNMEMLIAKIFNFEHFDSKIASNIQCKFIFCDFSTNYPDNVIIDNWIFFVFQTIKPKKEEISPQELFSFMVYEANNIRKPINFACGFS